MLRNYESFKKLVLSQQILSTNPLPAAKISSTADCEMNSKFSKSSKFSACSTKPDSTYVSIALYGLQELVRNFVPFRFSVIIFSLCKFQATKTNFCQKTPRFGATFSQFIQELVHNFRIKIIVYDVWCIYESKGWGTKWKVD